MRILKKFSSAVKIIILALFLSVGIGVIFAQWTNPPGPFPSGQPPAPVNVGSLSQVKEGSFWAGFLGSDGGLYVSGDSEAVGNVSIGERITIGGGSPAVGKILSSENNEGLGLWIDPPRLSCIRRSFTTASVTTEAAASCLTGEIVTGGGGDCEIGGNIELSSPSSDLTFWNLRCSRAGIISSYAICCSI